MTLFLDTANVEEVAKYMKWGVIKGITTNQKIFSMEQNLDHHYYEQRIKELLQYDVPVSIELTSNGTVGELIKEARLYQRKFDSENLVIKVPMWKDGKGLEVTKELLNGNIKVNMTCLIDINQAILAAELGATYVSLFYNRIIDYCKQKLEQNIDEATETALTAIDSLRDIIEMQSYESKIICGSIREPRDVKNCLAFGAHIVTVTPKVLEQLPFHPKTEETVTEFDEAWKKFTERK